jgi:energy-coupling factor transport system permease protein
MTELDPRTKFLLSIYYGVLIVASGHSGWLAMEWGILLLLVFIIGEGRTYLRWLRMLLPMALFFGAVMWWSVGVDAAFVAALKLLTLTSTFFIFFITTEPVDLGNSLVKMGMPYAFAFVLSTALQFIPVISRKAKDVLDAQRARGIPLEPGWSALRHYPAFLGPLLIQAFQLAEELAEAMEARGYGRPNRTFLKVYKLRHGDWLAMGGGFLILAACLLLQRLV